MVYWEYNLGITERNMEIKEYTEFKADEILQLYTQVGWTAYTEDMPALECGYKNSLLVLAAYENGELLGIVRVVGDGTHHCACAGYSGVPGKTKTGHRHCAA